MSRLRKTFTYEEGFGEGAENFNSDLLDRGLRVDKIIFQFETSVVPVYSRSDFDSNSYV